MPFIQVNDAVNLFYNMVGSGAKTAVLVHGAGATCRMWSLQMRALVEAGYKVIVYDVRGHGATLGTSGLYSIDLFADDLFGLLTALGVKERVYLCGLSMGGLIAQQFTLDHPEMVKALILSNTYSFLGYDYLSAALGVSVEELQNIKITNSYIYGVFSKANNEHWDLADNMLRASEMLLEQDRDRNLFFDDQVYIQSLEDRIKTQSATGSFDSRDRLCEIKCPTLVIGGEKDMIVPLPYSEYLHEHIPKSEFVVMMGSNHVPSTDNYELYNTRVIAFFNAHS